MAQCRQKSTLPRRLAIGAANQHLNALPPILERVDFLAVNQNVEPARLQHRFEPVRKRHILARVGDKTRVFASTPRTDTAIRHDEIAPALPSPNFEPTQLLAARKSYGRSRPEQFDLYQSATIAIRLFALQRWSSGMPKSPDPTDKHVGTRVRMRRLMLDLSQTALSDALGITFQQVQKIRERRQSDQCEQAAADIEFPPGAHSFLFRRPPWTVKQTG